ncbi:hypothetical protein N7510_011050 [Penicillium lagena]|uniref:uncharacterized protein n=1 Tax=Penicillium lagena TaxID=94218 RepID=UPI0025424309|nr:uncharacterized protein N7510_011050 [Penicillium lagena]KAJ5601516.1 hypothetical protein N7510_011050 [Penicillium lagena]
MTQVEKVKEGQGSSVQHGPAQPCCLRSIVQTSLAPGKDPGACAMTSARHQSARSEAAPGSTGSSSTGQWRARAALHRRLTFEKTVKSAERVSGKHSLPTSPQAYCHSWAPR